MEPEDEAAPGIGIEAVREAGLDACAFIAEWQGAYAGRQVLWETLAVFGRLDLDTGERRTLFFRLDDPGGAPIYIEEVVGGAVTRFEGNIADSYAPRGGQIHATGVLNGPPGLLKLSVYLLSCLVFWCPHLGP